MAPSKKFSVAEKGKAPREGPGSPAPKRGRDRPRKHTTTPAVAPCSRGGAAARGGGRSGRGSPVDEGRRAMVAQPPRPRFHSVEVPPEFVVWSEDPAGNWLQLQCFFVDELPASGSGGLWLQVDGCWSRASWVVVEVSAAGNIVLACGWQTFARARGLGRRCTLHFKYDGDATLYVKVFGEDGHRAGCCPETNDGEEVLGLGDGCDEGEPTGRASSSYQTESSSSGGYDQPPRRRARFEGGSGSSRRRASVKREEGSG